MLQGGVESDPFSIIRKKPRARHDEVVPTHALVGVAAVAVAVPVLAAEGAE